MNIEIINKKYLKKLYIFFTGKDKPVPLYLDTETEVNGNITSTTKKKLKEMQEIYGHNEKNEKVLLLKMNKYIMAETDWYKIDNNEIPFNSINVVNKIVIDRLIIKMLKSSTYQNTKNFIYSLLKQLTLSKKWTDKQKLIATCRAFGVSMFTNTKKDSLDIGFDEMGILEGIVKTDVTLNNNIIPIHKFESPIFIKKDNKVYVWKYNKFWVVFDIKLNKACRINETIINNYIAPIKFIREGASQFSLVREMLKEEEKKEKEKKDEKYKMENQN